MWNKRGSRAGGWNRRSAGVTLVELIVAIVIVGVALAGAVAAFARADRASADPVVAQQMAAIADSMMEEILLKPFNGAAAAANAPRQAYARLDDYDGYASKGIADVEGNPVGGLAAYSVAVTVLPVPGGLAGIPEADTRRITITVRHDAVPEPFVLSGWRTNPEPQP